MDPFLPISEVELNSAKSRIWGGMQSKMAARELTEFQPLLSALRDVSSEVKTNKLQRVQSKEMLLECLPNREVLAFDWGWVKKAWASGALAMLFFALLVPPFESHIVSASSLSWLEVEKGEVWLNGIAVKGKASVKEGDKLYSFNGALAHLSFADDSRITMGSEAHLTVVEVSVDPLHRKPSVITLAQAQGRTWTQVVNLNTTDSTFNIISPQGEVQVRQRASFDLLVQADQSEIKVARNLVDVVVTADENTVATVGQGTGLVLDSDTGVRELAVLEEPDEWWAYNESYGKEYTLALEQNYKREVVERIKILPGNPLYGIKTFREEVQLALSFTEGARQQVVVKQAETRLAEAQALVEQGRTEEAKDVLNVYESKVESIANTGDETLLASIRETQKNLLVKSGTSEGDQLIEEHIASSSTQVAGDQKKAGVLVESASQKLARVPDAVAAGDLELARSYLAEYELYSEGVDAQLSSMSEEEKAVVLADIFDQKMDDLKWLRVIAALPEFAQDSVAEQEILGQMDELVTDLREEVQPAVTPTVVPVTEDEEVLEDPRLKDLDLSHSDQS